MSETDQEPHEPSVEQRILVVMRQVLSSVVREVTPPPGMRNPLSEQTIEDIRQCFGLITAREKELNDKSGTASHVKPRYVDEPETRHLVEFDHSKPPKQDQ